LFEKGFCFLLSQGDTFFAQLPVYCSAMILVAHPVGWEESFTYLHSETILFGRGRTLSLYFATTHQGLKIRIREFEAAPIFRQQRAGGLPVIYDGARFAIPDNGGSWLRGYRWGAIFWRRCLGQEHGGPGTRGLLVTEDVNGESAIAPSLLHHLHFISKSDNE
jgi:hypothetical protein